MKIWLDTTNEDLVKQANKLGLLFGVTTNPALIAKSGKSMKAALRNLLDLQDGPVTAQVLARDAAGMIEQGQRLYDFSDRIIVKIPITEESLEAIHTLSHQEIPIMATVVFQPHQALMAALTGAHYIAPYVGQIEKAGKNPWETLTAMLTIYQKHQLHTEILAASISTVDQITRCAEIGIPHITLKEEAFRQLIATTPNTQERVDHFETLWNQSQATFI